MATSTVALPTESLVLPGTQPDRSLLPIARQGFRITLGGVLFVGMTILLAIAAVNNRSNLLLLLFSIGIGVFLIGAVFGAGTLAKVMVQRKLPAVAVAGRPFVVTYRLSNPRRRSRAFSIFLTDLPEADTALAPVHAFEPCIEPGESVTLTVPALIERRGKVTFSSIVLESRFPFGLLCRHRTVVQPETMVVLPALFQLRYLPLGRKPLDAGAVARKATHWFPGPEFAGLREFRHGDNPRWIHWRKSASTRELMIHERRQPPQQNVTLLLDLRITTTLEEQTADLEAIISAAATLGCDALERGFHVGLIAVGSEMVVIPPVGGREQRDRLLRQLAVLRYARNTPIEESLRNIAFQSQWQGTGFLLSCEGPESLRPVAGLLVQRIGPIEILVPGTVSFDERFVETAERTESRHDPQQTS